MAASFPRTGELSPFWGMDAFKESYPCVPTCATAWASVAAQVLSIQPASRSATTVALLDTECSRAIAARGKTSVDWFGGFKLHLVVNQKGELLNVGLTPGNTDDRKPVPQLLKAMFGSV